MERDDIRDEIRACLIKNGVLSHKELEMIYLKRKIQDLSIKLFDELGTIKWDYQNNCYNIDKQKLNTLMKLSGDLLIISNDGEAK